jgi:L-fuculose-phosphate aldolase
MIVAADGNVSARLGPDRMLITPSGVCKGFLDPADLIVTDMAGQPIRSGDKCSTEVAMHVACYKHRPDIQSVVHAHPPTAIAFSVAGRRLEPHVLPEVVVTLGVVPTLPYTDPGSYEVPDAIGPAIETAEAVILEFHGAVAVGPSVMQAYFKLEKVEHAAHILLMAHQLGGIRTLSGDAVAKLHDTQKRAGITIGLPPDYRSRGGLVGSGAHGAMADVDEEALIAQVTAAVMRQLKAGSRSRD